jgi:hypothetical protein
MGLLYFRPQTDVRSSYESQSLAFGLWSLARKRPLLVAS